MLHWLAHVLGLDSANGPFYLAWSGFAGQIPRLAILAGVFGAWHRWNCHVGGCWRLGRHRVGATNVVVCSHHHPRRESWWARHRHGRGAVVTPEYVAAIPPAAPADP